MIFTSQKFGRITIRPRHLMVALAGCVFAALTMAQDVLFEDGEMKDGFSGGVWQRTASIVYGGGTTGTQFTTGGGNPGAFLLVDIGGGVANGGRASTYAGPSLSVTDLADLGTFDYEFDLKIIDASTTVPNFSFKPVLFHNEGGNLIPLIYTGGGRMFTGSEWSTESWSNLTVADFALYDAFYANIVSPAAGRTGTFYVGFLAEVRTIGGPGFLNWGVDNVTILASPIPEPAAAGSLLALTGLVWAVMARRRRA